MPKSLETRSQAALSADALQFAAHSKAKNTVTAYKSAWGIFTAWCDDHGAASLPAEPATVTAYFAEMAKGKYKRSTIDVHAAAISAYHDTAGHSDPTKGPAVRAVLAGIRRDIGRPPKKKAAISADELRAVVQALPDNLNGKRDRALLLVGFAGAFRRSELVALDVDDLRINGEMKVTVRRGKTDQQGAGLVKSIPAVQSAELDAITAMRAWLNAAGIKSGPVFRQIDRWGNVRDARLTSQSVALILKRAALAAKLEPRQFSGHSLRSGFITSAAEAGAHEWEIQEQTGHKSAAVLRGYIQAAGKGAKRAVLAAINGTSDDKH